MMKRLPGAWAPWTALLLTLLAVPARAQVTAGDLELDLTGRVQVQLNSTSVSGEDLTGTGADTPPSWVFETRRVRFGATFVYGEGITGKVEGDFAKGGAQLTDGYVDVRVAEPLSIRAGQFKKPFGVIELESSTRTRVIERGLDIRGLEDRVGVPGEAQWLLDEGGYLGRQIGVMAHGAAGGLEYAAGVFNGEGANQSETAGSKAYAARVTYGLLAGLEVGGAVSVQPTGRFDGEDEVHGTVYAVEATWGGFRQAGLHAKGEWFLGDNPLLGAGVELATMTGAHAVVAWFAPLDGRIEGVEPALRLSWGDPDGDVDGDEGVLVTPGVNLYFSGRNRLALNGDIYLPSADGLDPELALVAQMQVYF